MSDQDGRVAMLLAQEDWNAERRRLREIILSSGLDESIRWGKLCYSHAGGNVALIFALKSYCAVGFFKGSLLEDDKGLLVAPGKNSQAMRQMRFAGLDEIEDARHELLSYLKSAIALEASGAKIDFTAGHDGDYPTELRDVLDGDAELAVAFEALTPGRRRGYVIHFSGAKQSATRRSRIENCREKIMAGRGLNERGANRS